MLAAEVKEKFRKKLRNGEPDGEIREQMRAAGYTNGEIDEVFKPANRGMGPWYIFCTTVSLFTGIILFGKEPAGISPLCFSLSVFCIYKYIRLAYTKIKE
jgi:hypothetical protein